MRIVRVLAACVCVLALLVVAGCGPAVPELKGKTLEQAKAALSAVGFSLGAVTYDEAAAGAPGAVIAQEPVSGSRTKEGSSIAVTVAGPAPVPAPAVMGLDQLKATEALTAAGLTLGAVTEVFDPKVAKGTIISQEPSAGVEVPKGGGVAVSVSKGPQPVAVPKVVGMTAAAARASLEAAGFVVSNTSIASGTVKKGIVAGQSPADGAEAQPGSKVTITISTGVALVRVPAINGLMSPDGIIKKAGLVPVGIAIHGPIDADAPDIGRAYRQSPKAGTMVPKGSKVTYRYWWEAG
ncbi:MAG: PASTA domain-containing protein [Coriobacteriia bacterium]|nr:PASTA domain-containing protein [Coriobacteriia bacterium]